MKKLLLIILMLIGLVSCQKDFVVPLTAETNQTVIVSQDEWFCIYHVFQYTDQYNNPIEDTIAVNCTTRDEIFYWDDHEYPDANAYRTKPTTNCNCN